MPHFLLYTTQETITPEQEDEILMAVHETAFASGLFKEDDIKVRIERFEKSTVGGKMNHPFVHVFAYIMQGRSTEQKAALSESIVHCLQKLLPEVSPIAMNVSDFEAATYYNPSK
ncbi:5-carboxymethyl-2-hydroxymuconate Delta-isomerase [Ekhidna sp.]